MAALRNSMHHNLVAGVLATVFILSILAVVSIMAGCSPASAPVPAPAPTPSPVPAPKPSTAPSAPVPVVPALVKDVAAVTKAWENSAHNNKYDLGRGPNTFCARCHSPQNWDPAAKPGPTKMGAVTLPSCVSCKFPADKEVRISTTAPLIAAADWKVISCTVCHKVEAGGTDPRPVIWNNANKSYDSVSDNTALCEKCHTDSVNGTRHKVKLGGGAHSNQIGMTSKRPEQCTDCHNPHSLKADCNSCHGAALKTKTIKGHDPAHSNVTCVACHDASEMKVGRVEGTKIFTTGTVTGSGTTEVFTRLTSHDFKKAADCKRCHYDKNPWGLSVIAPATGGRPS